MRASICAFMLLVSVDALRRLPDLKEKEEGKWQADESESETETSEDLQLFQDFAKENEAHYDAMDEKDNGDVRINNWYGRLGNNLIQVCNAIEIAEEQGGKVFLPSKEDSIKEKSGGFFEVFDTPVEIKVQKVEKRFACRAKERRRSFPYWGQPHTKRGDNCFSQNERHRVMQTYLRPYLRSSNDTLTKSSHDELVIHLRAGDLLDEDSGVANFAQGNMPPCAAYDSVLHKFKRQFSKVRIVTTHQGRKDENPCITEIQKRNPDLKVTVQSSSVIDDFVTMVNSKNLFLAYSTYSYTAYTMSTEVNNLFSVKGASFISGPTKKVDGTNLFIINVPGQNQQRLASVEARKKWMINTPEDQIQFVSGGDKLKKKK